MEKILIKDGKKRLIFSLEDIIWVQADNFYSKVYIGEEIYVIKKNLKKVAEKIESEKLIRISRNALINIDKIVEIDQGDNNQPLILMENNHFVKGSKGSRKKLNLLEL